MSAASAFAGRHTIQVYAFALTVLLGLFALAPAILVTVPAGNVGVLWLRFFGGTVTDKVLDEGIHLIAPWDVMTLYDVRINTDTRTYEALTNDGLPIKVEVSVRYRLNPPAVGLLHKLIGPDFVNSLIAKEVSNYINEYASSQSPEAFYSESRLAFSSSLLAVTREQFKSPPEKFFEKGGLTRDPYATLNESLLRIEDALVGRITLPAAVEMAIEQKMQEQQRLQEYQFKIASARKEAERKRIEAEGIRDYQAIVSTNITEDYLRLNGIEATRALANSPNSKTIIIGGRDGLPLILNPSDNASPKQELGNSGIAMPNSFAGPH